MSSEILKTIQAIPASERPRERCLEKGPASLSFRECLALLIHSGPPGRGCLGVAADLLALPGTGLDEAEQVRAFFTALEVSAQAHLQTVRGLGPTAQARLLAAFELARRYSILRSQNASHRAGHGGRPSPPPEEALKRISPAQRNSPQEWLGFVPVYGGFGNRELGSLCIVEKGVRTHVNIDPAELFARLLALRPTGFFLFHNHPGGGLQASPADLDLTLRIQEVAQLLGIRLLGHGIVTAHGESWVPVPALGRIH